MIRKIYSIVIEHFDPFRGMKYTTYTANNIIDALDLYHKNRSFDYDFDDSYTETNFPKSHFTYTPDTQTRLHARSKYEWERLLEKTELDAAYDPNTFMFFDEDEIAAILNLINEEALS